LKNILVLFPNEWDHLEFSAPRYKSKFRFFYEGFDLQKFPENAKLMYFDALKFVDRIEKKYGGRNFAGVLSNEEQFGTLIASVVAERMGLPFASPPSILLAQHKYYARLRSRDVAPAATPKFAVFPYTVRQREEIDVAFPMFVKPVKATYSILARRADSFAEIKSLLTFKPLETQILKRLIKPANDIAALYTRFEIDTHHLIAEELLEGVQVTVDGFADNGKIQILGIVDSIMYPGTSAFQRFEYPSSLPPAIQARMTELVQSVMAGFGFTHGLFNIELAYDAASDSIKIIELNPRMAYQFADLYEKVDGYNPYDVLLDLAVGESPRLHSRQGLYRNAASFVLRAFPGARLVGAPNDMHLETIRREHRDARVMIYVKKGSSLAREYKWLGSYRYAVLNIGAESNHDLFHRFYAVRDQLPFVFA
jgi:hypothetical protein